MLSGVIFSIGCDAAKDAVDQASDMLGECPSVCAAVQECGVTPPSPAIDFGGLADGLPDIAALDCATNCVQEDRAFYGYSDCQIECLLGEGCGTMADCWDVSSDAYASYCLADVDTTPVAPEEGTEEAEAIDNGTNTGSEDADSIVDNPAVEESVEDSDFDVNYGNNPPSIEGVYSVDGSIDESSNARAPGSPIVTSICFSGQQSLTGGSELNYCETGVPGTATAPVTGSGNDFTIYLEYPGAAAILFSGSVIGDPTAPTGVENAEAMVVYYHGIDIWEHSWTDWVREGECTGC
jgi:hypothetical protein